MPARHGRLGPGALGGCSQSGVGRSYSSSGLPYVDDCLFLSYGFFSLSKFISFVRSCTWAGLLREAIRYHRPAVPAPAPLAYALGSFSLVSTLYILFILRLVPAWGVGIYRALRWNGQFKCNGERGEARQGAKQGLGNRPFSF